MYKLTLSVKLCSCILTSMYIAMNLLYTQLLLHRRPKADDRVHFQSPDDAVTFDGFENPMSKDPSSKHIIARDIL